MLTAFIKRALRRMVNARDRRRAFFIERACFFDTCGAEKIKGVGDR